MKANPRVSVIQQAVVIGSVSIEEVLLDDGSLEAPFNIATFERFCRRNYAEESLDFWKQIQQLRKMAATIDDGPVSGDSDPFRMKVAWILATYVEQHSECEINISSSQRQYTIDAVKHFLCEDQTCLQRQDYKSRGIVAFDQAQREIVKVMMTDLWPRFIEYACVRETIGLSREIALWWRNPNLTWQEFFSFPSPINILESRLNNMCTFLLSLLTIFLIYKYDWPYLCLYLVYGFFVRTLSGPRVDPQAFLVLFVLRPLFEDYMHIGKSEFFPGTPFRFAQACGLLFSLAGTILYFIGQPTLSLIPFFALFLASGVASFTGFCAACAFFHVMCKMGLISTDVAESVNLKFVDARKTQQTAQTFEKSTAVLNTVNVRI